MTGNEINYRLADTQEDFEEGKRLFKEYVASLGVDLSFQDFENELQLIDQQYNKPAGALLLVYDNGSAIGCAGIRKFDEETMERAQALYKSFGFYEIASYRFNPLEGTVYMEKLLRS